MSVAIQIENVSKQYRLGEVGTGTLSHDLHRAWAKMRGKPDPFAKVGEVNNREEAGGEYVWALRDINFEVQQGEILGIIGRNGAGKSTLLKLLSRVTAPTTGAIKTKGRIASLLEVGTGFHPELTGRENVYLNGAIMGMTRPEITRRLEEIVEFSGCAKYIDTPVKRYSSGMMVRLGFAVAAHLDCEILVVDEVLAVGDLEFQRKCIGKMQDVSKTTGKTVLFVSHNMASVMELCAAGVLLEDGGTVFEGPIDAAINHYLRPRHDKNLSLAERSDRIGSGALRFTDLKFLRGGETVAEIVSCEPVQINIHFRVDDDIDVQLVTFVVRFEDQNGQVAALFASDEMHVDYADAYANGILKLSVPEFLLRGGHYSICLFASYMNTQPENFLDVIENAGSLTVITGKYWKGRRENRPGSYSIIPGQFEIGSSK